MIGSDRKPVFFDTNVLIYLASADLQKAGRIEQLLAQGGFVSVQVLNELAHVLRRKFSFSLDEINLFLDALRALVTVEPMDVETHLNGMRIAERYGYSIWDCMIIASAQGAQCLTLCSEDMADGQVIDGTLTIMNPFTQPW